MNLRQFVLTALSLCVLAACSKSETDGGSALSAPSGLQCTAQTETSLTFAWNRVEGAERYNYQLTDSKGTTLKAESVTATTVSIASLTAGTTYRFRVQAAAGKSVSDYTAYLEATTDRTLTPLAAPKPSVAEATETTLKFTWTAVDKAAGYAWRLLGAGDAEVKTGETAASVTACEIAGLDKATTYTFAVKALAAAGGDSSDSDWSTALSASTERGEQVVKPACFAQAISASSDPAPAISQSASSLRVPQRKSLTLPPTT